MFNKKLLSVLAYVVGALLAVKALFISVMFGWSFFGQPPVMIFNPGAPLTVNILLFVQELGTLVFFFLAVGFVHSLLGNNCCDKPKAQDLVKAATKAVSRAKKTVRKVAAKK